MAVFVFNGAFFLSTSRNNAVLSQGKNVSNSWTLNGKSNFVVGQIAGNINAVPAGANILNDLDAVDNPIADIGIKSPLGASVLEVV